MENKYKERVAKYGMLLCAPELNKNFKWVKHQLKKIRQQNFKNRYRECQVKERDGESKHYQISKNSEKNKEQIRVLK